MKRACCMAQGRAGPVVFGAGISMCGMRLTLGGGGGRRLCSPPAVGRTEASRRSESPGPRAAEGRESLCFIAPRSIMVSLRDVKRPPIAAKRLTWFAPAQPLPSLRAGDLNARGDESAGRRAQGEPRRPAGRAPNHRGVGNTLRAAARRYRHSLPTRRSPGSESGSGPAMCSFQRQRSVTGCAALRSEC